MRKLIAIGIACLALTACGGQGESPYDQRQRYNEQSDEFYKEYIRCSDPETGQIIHDRYDDCDLDK